jgi:hypothetical protein
MNKNLKLNNSGCKDPTAYEAITTVFNEQQTLEKRVHTLINVLKFIIDWAGFDLIARIEIRDRKTGKDFR